jgi:hypothetical protein
MKNKILLILILSIQFSYGQEISVSDFPNKILGKWRLMSFNDISEKYIETDNYYVFKGNNILEEYDNNTLEGTLEYEISFSENSYNGRIVKLANIKITDPSFGDIVKYQLDIFIDEDSIMRLALEAEGTAVNSLYKKT